MFICFPRGACFIHPLLLWKRAEFQVEKDQNPTNYLTLDKSLSLVRPVCSPVNTVTGPGRCSWAPLSLTACDFHSRNPGQVLLSPQRSYACYPGAPGGQTRQPGTADINLLTALKVWGGASHFTALSLHFLIHTLISRCQRSFLIRHDIWCLESSQHLLAIIINITIN